MKEPPPKDLSACGITDELIQDFLESRSTNQQPAIGIPKDKTHLGTHETIGVQMAAGISIVLGRKPHRKPQQVKSEIDLHVSSLKCSSSLARFCRDLIEHCVQVKDFGDIEPFLAKAEEALSQRTIVHINENRKTSEVQKCIEEIGDAISRGVLNEYMKRQPDVEEWINQQAQKIALIVSQSKNLNWKDSETVFRHILAVSIGIYEITTNIQHITRISDEKTEKEYSFVNACIAEIGQSIECTVIRYLALLHHQNGASVEEVSELVEQLLGHALDFENMNFQSRRLPNDSKYSYVKRTVRILEKYIQNEIYNNISDLLFLINVTPLAEDIEKEIDCSSRSKNEVRALPWGPVTLVKPCKHTNASLVYTADGVKNISHLALSFDEEELTGLIIGYSNPLLRKTEEDKFDVPNAFGCSLDSDLRLRGLDDCARLAPAPQIGEHDTTSEIIRGADHTLNTDLCSIWEKHPTVFAQVSKMGPIVLLESSDGCLYLIIRSKYAQNYSEASGASIHDAEKTKAVLKESRLKTFGEWSSLTLSEKQEESVTETDNEVKDDKYWRRMIRNKIGQRVPSLDWIIDHLKIFGTVEQTTQGKGSHSSVTLHTSVNGPQKDTVSRRMESTESIPWQIMWEFIERMKISYEDFYKSLE